MNNTSIFGTKIYKEGIKLEEITMIPNDTNLDKLSFCVKGINYISLADWEAYCESFITKNNIYFPNGKYEATYTINNEKSAIIDDIFDDETKEADSTRHIKLKISSLDSLDISGVSISEL